MKRRWWLIPIGLMLALALILFAFWDAIAVRICPSVILSKALIHTADSLETRLENSPITVLAKGIDLKGNHNIDFQLDTSNSVLGAVQYHMDIQTMGNPRKLNAKGTVSLAERSLNLTVYADKDFAAVASDNLLDGQFYGITYDSFHDDIRAIPLLSLLIGEKTLNEWESSLNKIQTFMGQTPDYPNFTEEDVRAWLLGLLTLRPQVTGETLSVSGQELDVYKLTYSATGQQIASVSGEYVKYMSAEVLELVKKFANDEGSSVSASFYTLDGTVVKAAIDAALEGERLQVELIFGQDAAHDPVKLALIQQDEDKLQKLAIDISSQYDQSQYAEVWNVTRIENGIQHAVSADYQWDLSGGDLVVNLKRGGQACSVLLNLKPVDNGFRLATEQFENLVSLFSETPKTGNSSCKMIISKGAQVTTPEYMNIDQWTGEIFMSLLGSIGALLGLQI